ncbi:bifunctional sugar phosphate isomerase/epimerase/4-hydroxyphenylpyruvate dioxygenase family protein [Pseudonocardia broussonetiae]|uniref:3-dehydroshikimate dehydratase n=1 Tax=Pseudonocardia broussonetiae TaxID=2736640 RepID=A0A6M6JNH9_9PSEU|nr:sugar phosphate isomerase/epimerase and 4-hydroxyphenylpyruvate domain-containing protein [Pseudonocardia broussonetiae]QJY48915.1 sugar phosphate isomerase/epimerase and 4-hydroxyphenylpyruvate domain-containing protein [Pseudonocardia broussonetiae]
MTVSARPTAAPQPAGPATHVRTALATVCISGTLEDKLDAAAAAGFDGVEIFEPDLVASSSSPAAVRSRCADLGLSIDLYQPFRDFDDVRPEVVEANLRRAERKFDVMEQLGTDLVLVCSSCIPTAVAEDDRIAEQLHRLAVRAAARGIRVAYEALAWGREVNTYERSWEVVRRADHPALGLCVDSFHILSRGSDPAGIRDIPADKLFFLQLADAPMLDMDVLQWSRHHRLFPGQGTFDLPAFLGHVLSAGYDGPLSLEVFNDVFRQSDPRRTAVDARRSLLALAEATTDRVPPAVRGTLASTALPPEPTLRGYAFAELAVDAGSAPALAATLAALGFTHSGQHRSKPVQLWRYGAATVLVNASGRPGAAVAAIGVETADPGAALRRAEALLAPAHPQPHGPAEADLSAVAAPDGTEVFFCRTGADDATSWLSDFVPTGTGTDAGDAGITHIDHVALTQPFDSFDEAALFYRGLLGLRTQHASEVAAPFGLVRNRAVSDAARTVRLCLSVSVLRRGEWGPAVTDPQHVAFATDDVLAVARAARAAGAPVLDIPDNYYDDLDARLAPPPDLLARMRELGVLLDRDADGEFLHFYTEVLGGRVFFEVVQRVAGYAGYGELNGPVRMAAHRRQRARAGDR